MMRILIKKAHKHILKCIHHHVKILESFLENKVKDLAMTEVIKEIFIHSSLGCDTYLTCCCFNETQKCVKDLKIKTQPQTGSIILKAIKVLFDFNNFPIIQCAM